MMEGLSALIEEACKRPPSMSVIIDERGVFAKIKVGGSKPVEMERVDLPRQVTSDSSFCRSTNAIAALWYASITAPPDARSNGSNASTYPSQKATNRMC